MASGSGPSLGELLPDPCSFHSPAAFCLAKTIWSQSPSQSGQCTMPRSLSSAPQDPQSTRHDFGSAMPRRLAISQRLGQSVHSDIESDILGSERVPIAEQAGGELQDGGH